MSTTDDVIEIVCVSVGGQLLALDIRAVREIRGWTTSTPLPQAPGYVRGMINLRGSILPVVDLGWLLGLGETELGSSSVVVVTQVGERQVGCVVDGVSDILVVGVGELQPPPQVGAHAPGVVRSVISRENGIICLLALEQVLDVDLDVAA